MDDVVHQANGIVLKMRLVRIARLEERGPVVNALKVHLGGDPIGKPGYLALHCLFGPDDPDHFFSRVPQLLPDRRGLHPVVGQQAIRVLVSRAHLFEEAPGLVIGSLAGGDQEAQDERREGAYESGTQMDGPLGLIGEMLRGEKSLDHKPGQCSPEDQGEGEQRDLLGVHMVAKKIKAGRWSR